MDHLVNSDKKIAVHNCSKKPFFKTNMSSFLEEKKSIPLLQTVITPSAHSIDHIMI